MRIILANAGKKFQVLYKKSALQLPADILAKFDYWQKHPNTSLDADTTMLALAEKVVRIYGGEIIVPAGALLEISLPIGLA